MTHIEWLTTLPVEFDPMDFAMARDDTIDDLITSLVEQYAFATFAWHTDHGIDWLTIRAPHLSDVQEVVDEAIGDAYDEPIVAVVVDDEDHVARHAI